MFADDSTALVKCTSEGNYKYDINDTVSFGLISTYNKTYALLLTIHPQNLHVYHDGHTIWNVKVNYVR